MGSILDKVLQVVGNLVTPIAFYDPTPSNLNEGDGTPFTTTDDRSLRTVVTAPIPAAQLFGAIPGISAQTEAVRIVPTGPVSQDQCLGTVPPNEMTATGEPTPGQKRLAVGIVDDGWTPYQTPGGSPELTKLITPNRCRVVYVGAINNTSDDLWVTMHDTADFDADPPSEANRRGHGIFLPKGVGDGWFREPLPFPRFFSSGFAVALSTTGHTYTAAAAGASAWFEVWYKI